MWAGEVDPGAHGPSAAWDVGAQRDQPLPQQLAHTQDPAGPASDRARFKLRPTRLRPASAVSARELGAGGAYSTQVNAPQLPDVYRTRDALAVRKVGARGGSPDIWHVGGAALESCPTATGHQPMQTWGLLHRTHGQPRQTLSWNQALQPPHKTHTQHKPWAGFARQGHATPYNTQNTSVGR